MSSKYVDTTSIIQVIGCVFNDLSILDNDVIRNVIEGENEIDSKAGLEIKASKGKGTNLDDGKEVADYNENSDKTDGESSSNDESAQCR